MCVSSKLRKPSVRTAAGCGVMERPSSQRSHHVDLFLCQVTDTILYNISLHSRTIHMKLSELSTRLVVLVHIC